MKFGTEKIPVMNDCILLLLLLNFVVRNERQRAGTKKRECSSMARKASTAAHSANIWRNYESGVINRGTLIIIHQNTPSWLVTADRHPSCRLLRSTSTISLPGYILRNNGNITREMPILNIFFFYYILHIDNSDFIHLESNVDVLLSSLCTGQFRKHSPYTGYH